MNHLLPEMAGAATGDAGLATLELISQARENLTAARSLPDIRRVMEMASLAVDAAERAARLFNAERRAAEVVEAATAAANDAAAVRIEAQAKAGELLRRMREQGERSERGRPQKTSHRATFSGSDGAPVSLHNLGVTRAESSRWQQVASIAPELRGQYVEETKAAKGEVSTAGLLRYATDRTGEQLAEQAGPLSITQRGRPPVPLNRTPPSVRSDGGAAETSPADYDHVHREAAWTAIFELRGLVDLPGCHPEELVDAAPLDDRKHLFDAVREVSAWCDAVRRELETQSTIAGNGEARDQPAHHWSTRPPAYEGEVREEVGRRWVGKGKGWVIDVWQGDAEDDESDSADQQ